MNRRSAWIAAATAAVLLVTCGLVWWLLRSDDEPRPPSLMADPPAPLATVLAPEPVAPVPGPCDEPATQPFTPERITIDGLTEGAAVIGVPGDARGVTGVLPTSNKVDFAWDLGGIRPGSRRGNVLLNTHTWQDGTSLGNTLLADLDIGDRIIVQGRDARLCYRVNLRIELPVDEGYPPYYETKGPPRIAIIVCSGRRTGPGQWTHRTIWFARQLSAA